MNRKWGKLLSVLLFMAVLSTASVAWAGSVRPVQAGADEGVCSSDGPDAEPRGEGRGCRDACLQSYEQCLQTAKKDYEKLLEDCRGLPHPTERAGCFKAAAEAYTAMIQACKAAHEACMETCGRH